MLRKLKISPTCCTLIITEQIGLYVRMIVWKLYVTITTCSLCLIVLTCYHMGLTTILQDQVSYCIMDLVKKNNVTVCDSDCKQAAFSNNFYLQPVYRQSHIIPNAR